MKTPLLFGKRRRVPASSAADYVGTDVELDQKVPLSDRSLKTDIRPLVGTPEAAKPAG